MSSTVRTSMDGVDEAAAIVEFYDGRYHMDEDDRRLAIEEGRMNPEDPDYIEVPFVKVKFPGRADLVVDRPAFLEGNANFLSDPLRWPEAWQRYKSKSGTVSGTPLHELRSLTESDIAFLEGKGIRSIELLESMSDTQIAGAGMGMRRFRDIARNWRMGQPTRDQQTQEEIDTLRAELAEMRAMLNSKPRRPRDTEKEAA